MKRLLDKLLIPRSDTWFAFRHNEIMRGRKEREFRKRSEAARKGWQTRRGDEVEK